MRGGDGVDADGGWDCASLEFLEEIYARFLRAPESVPAEWRRRFERLGAGDPFAEAPRLQPSFEPPRLYGNGARASPAARTADPSLLQERVDQLVRDFRARGHLAARLDPLGQARPKVAELDPAYHGIAEADLDQRVGEAREPLRDLIERLRSTYCRSIGVQFLHIEEREVREWLQERMESTQNRLLLRPSEQVAILAHLTRAVVLEEFIQKKFLGAKSFSLEGAESLIPLLELVIEEAGAYRVDEIVFGMAHRGRLNVLVNVLGKSARDVFAEFEDQDAPAMRGQGDVKYHLGHSSDRVLAGGQRLHLSLCFNPSHLEFVDPVALGRMRAKQDRAGDLARERGLAVLIHGDAAFAGEGVVQETLNLSLLPAYTVGGALHVIVNNQIGFTTGPLQARSSIYCSAVGKLLASPVFHVNGEDPEAVAQVVKLAMAFRARWKRDVVVDMYCYRRRGHNESDEPSFTQPVLYRQVRERKSVRDGYLDHLFELGGVSRQEAEADAERARLHLEAELTRAKASPARSAPDPLPRLWDPYRGGAEPTEEPSTGLDAAQARFLLERLTALPAGFHPHPKLDRLLAPRREMAAGQRPLDWATAELLALASLAHGGVRVRLTGQDSERGTFSQRHAVLHDAETGEAWSPLWHLGLDQAPVEIANSPLSEAGVLGFEYGYSLDCPDGLVLWEAQFGDFVNAAQVIVDQFLAAAESKWQRLSGVVLLLPHGFEGQGPEHSSARLERFLQLAAEDNLQVAQPTTPAQHFHLLRRQALRPWRKPLVVMTPKSLLREARATSSLEDLGRSGFERVLVDAPAPDAVRRIVLCTGKLYYDLGAARRERGRDADVALVRLEQLYPLGEARLRAALAVFPPGTPVVWAQEEPENMGAWHHVRARFGHLLSGLRCASRRESASPATGSLAAHRLEQAEIVAGAFA